jgi:hypothetical protein
MRSPHSLKAPRRTRTCNGRYNPIRPCTTYTGCSFDTAIGPVYDSRKFQLRKTASTAGPVCTCFPKSNTRRSPTVYCKLTHFIKAPVRFQLQRQCLADFIRKYHEYITKMKQLQLAVCCFYQMQHTSPNGAHTHEQNNIYR